MPDWKWFAPIPLAREKPISQSIVHRLTSQAAGLKVSRDFCLEFEGRKTIVGPRINGNSMIEETVGRACRFTNGRDDWLDFNLKLIGEFKVTLVMSWNGHDCSGPVTDQHIVSDPDRNLLAINRIDRIATGENSALSLREVCTIKIALRRCLLTIGFNHTLLFRCGYPVYGRMLRRKDHISHAK